MNERGPRERLQDQLARRRGYLNYATAHDEVRQAIDTDVEEALSPKPDSDEPDGIDV